MSQTDCPPKRVPASRRSPLRYSSIGRQGTLSQRTRALSGEAPPLIGRAVSSGRKGFVRKSSATGIERVQFVRFIGWGGDCKNGKRLLLTPQPNDPSQVEPSGGSVEPRPLANTSYAYEGCINVSRSSILPRHLLEDHLPRQPIAYEQRDLFHSEVRRFRAVVRQMVEAGFQRYGGTVGTHSREARSELRDIVLALLQAMDTGQPRPHTPTPPER